jgi:hypothetical protein
LSFQCLRPPTSLMAAGKNYFTILVKTLAAVCPCPPWYPEETWWGTYNWSSVSPPICSDGDTRVKHYGTEIEYICPEGFVFVVPEGENETGVLNLKCETWADWDPPYTPECHGKSNCNKFMQSYWKMLSPIISLHLKHKHNRYCYHITAI